MRGKRAKKLRKSIYGDKSIREREYHLIEKKGIIITDDRRRLYKQAKKMWYKNK